MKASLTRQCQSCGALCLGVEFPDASSSQCLACCSHPARMRTVDVDTFGSRELDPGELARQASENLADLLARAEEQYERSPLAAQIRALARSAMAG